ncbi:cdc42 effector protein 2 [Erythrolamprus reginae]|uniref:cdc42 effector protein 2 n=1 Tax=Erythrolamprus reginae TaxID=121349 RepID=UPI00396CDF46
MAATKVPIYLKRGSRRGKKEKLRDILSSEMISPPLGDFRHTIHIGNQGEGDMFGDISFLQGKFHLLPRSDKAAPFEFSRTSALSRYEPLSLDIPSPLLKNAISLPIIGGLQALTLPSAQAPPKPPRLHLDDKDHAAPPAEVYAQRLANNGWASEALEDPKPLSPPFLPHAGSLLSLHVDLGPSIMDDVLGVMEKHHTVDTEVKDTGRQEILT